MSLTDRMKKRGILPISSNSINPSIPIESSKELKYKTTITAIANNDSDDSDDHKLSNPCSKKIVSCELIISFNFF